METEDELTQLQATTRAVRQSVDALLAGLDAEHGGSAAAKAAGEPAAWEKTPSDLQDAGDTLDRLRLQSARLDSLQARLYQLVADSTGDETRTG